MNYLEVSVVFKHFNTIDTFFVVFRSKGGKMIKVKDGKLQAELLDNKGTLSNKIIEQYDYIELKNDFAEIVDILSTNMLVHAMYQEALKYEITEDLEFKIFIDENVKDYTMTYDFATNYSYFSKTNSADKSPENNIDCPFVELGLIGMGSKPKTFRKKTPLIDNFNPYITLALILDFSKKELGGKSEIQLNSLLQNKNSIGKVFNLDSISLIDTNV